MIIMNPNRLVLWIKLSLISLCLSLSSITAPLVNQAVAAAPSNSNYYLPFMARDYPYNWLQFNGDALHSGSNTIENQISVSSVANLQLLFQVALPGIADGAPVYLSDVNTSSGVRDLIFVTTQDGHIAA